MKTGKIYINNKSLDTLLAISDHEQEKGLMYQKWPPPVMSFIYKNSRYNKFWMKNTPSPLDIIFCRDNKIHSIYEGIPFSTAAIGPNLDTDLVIELPKGYCEKFGFKSGDEVIVVFD